MGGKWREVSLLILLGLLWGMPFALTKISLVDITPVTLVACRVLLAAAALWLVVLVRHGTRFGWRCLRLDIFLQGMLACVVPYALITLGQRSVPSGLAAILNSTIPIFVCLISAIWFGRAVISGERLLGLALGLGGVVLIVGTDALLSGSGSMVGQLAIIVATLSSAVAAMYGRRFGGLPPEVVAAGTLASGAMVLVPLSFLLEAPLLLSPSTASLLALSANGLVATAAGFVIYFRLIQTLGSIGAASVSYLKPAFGLLIGIAVMGEMITWPVGLGLAAILAGVTFTNGGTGLRFVPRTRAHMANLN